MIVYRITTKKHAADLSGLGAALYGGRWNKKGTPVLYTGESKEIALLETLVHIPSLFIPQSLMLTLEIPDDSIFGLAPEELPKSWHEYPAPSILAEIAENWVQDGESIALKVPSCIIHSAHIVILNCAHPDYPKVKLLQQSDFRFDTRLLR